MFFTAPTQPQKYCKNCCDPFRICRFLIEYVSGIISLKYRNVGHNKNKCNILIKCQHLIFYQVINHVIRPKLRLPDLIGVSLVFRVQISKLWTKKTHWINQSGTLLWPVTCWWCHQQVESETNMMKNRLVLLLNFMFFLFVSRQLEVGGKSIGRLYLT